MGDDLISTPSLIAILFIVTRFLFHSYFHFLLLVRQLFWPFLLLVATARKLSSNKITPIAFICGDELVSLRLFLMSFAATMVCSKSI